MRNLHRNITVGWTAFAALVLFAIVVAMVCCSATRAYAYPQKVERWRHHTTYYLKQHGVYSAARVNRMLHIIEGESGGSAGAVYGRHLGLVQMTPSWSWWPHIKRYHKIALRKRGSRYVGHRYVSDWRKCGACQLHRMAHVWKRPAKVRQHWAATYW